MHPRAEHLLQRVRHLCGDALAAEIEEEQAHHRQQQLHGVAPDAADEVRDLVEGVVGDLAQFEPESVRILGDARAQIAQLIADPRQPQ
jgi:hypothetical protein